MSNNALKYIVLAGLFAVPFVPFTVMASLFFPFIAGKAFIFRIVVEVILLAYLVLAIRDEEYRPKFSWTLGAVAAFLVVMAFATAFGENPFKSFWSNYERMEGYVTLLHLAAYFLVMGSVLKTQEIWNKLLSTTLFASFIMSAYSFFQIAGKIQINQGGVRVDGTLGNASYLGIYMVFHIFFAALLFSRARLIWQKVLISVVTILNFIVLYFTATRGAILGLLGGALISFLLLVWKSEKGDKIRKFAVVGLGVLIIVVGLFFAARNTSFVQNSPVLSRFASLSVSEIKTQGRYYVWPMAIKGFAERPVLGWGQEGFNFVFNKYYDPRMYGQEPWFDRAHNTYLDWLIAGGALGLLTYLSILFSLFYYIFKASDDFLKREDKAIILGVLSAYMFNNLFVFDQISSYILFFTIIAYVHSHAPETHTSLWNKISSKFKNILEEEKWHPAIEAVLLITLVAIMNFFVISPWRQNVELLNVLRLNNEGTVGTAEAYLKPISNYKMSFPEGLEHVSQTAIALAGSSNASPELKQNVFNGVDEAFKKQIEKVPTDARYRLFYGLFLSRFGWYGRAIEQLEEAKKLSPKKQSIYFELANNYLLDGKGAEALQNAKTAYDLEPSFAEAKMIYGLVALSTGNIALSNQILGDTDPAKLVFDDRYISVLISLKQFDKAIEIAKLRVAADPSDNEHRITLTAVYLQANRRAEAIRTLEEIIAIDPSFKEKGEYYISEIKAGRNP